MQKTKLGITVGMLGATVYLAGLFGGYLVAIVLAGYILLYEENEWLKKSAVKAITLMICFSFFSISINVISNGITCIHNIVAIFDGSFSIDLLSKFIVALNSIIDLFEKILFLDLGLKALNQGTISVPIVDKLISKYMG